MTASEELLALARKRFSDPLSPAEQKLFQAVANGQVADYTDPSEAENDPARAKAWGGYPALPSTLRSVGGVSRPACQGSFRPHQTSQDSIH